MSDNELPQADIQDEKGLSKAWLLPIIAIIVGVWILLDHWQNQGSLIQIEFPRATGLEVEKTKIRTRDLEVGVVKRIELKDDLSGVIVTARLEPDTDRLLGTDTEFWIVTPRISLAGVEGLNTILSGSYIAMSPASQTADVRDFVALEEPPVTPPGTPGLHITLNSNDEFAFKEGDPIIYKGLKVGEFEDIYFNLDERIVYYNAFIEAPYHQLITTNTKFWNASGVRFDLDASGIKIETASLETLLTNGVTFGIPEGIPPGPRITERSFFDIYPSHDAASEERYTLSAEFAILIEDTVRGLHEGAPVEYRGVEIGKVLSINPPLSSEHSLLDEGYAIPVIISIQPARVQLPDTEDGVEKVIEQTLHRVDQGLRASLKLGNLVTGAQYVDLQLYDDVQETEPSRYLDYAVIPTISGEFAQLTEKANQLLDKLNQLPIEALSEQATKTLKDMSNTALAFQATSKEYSDLANKIDQQGLSENINRLLASAEQLVKDYSAGSASHDAINKSLSSLQKSLSTLQPLLQQLNKAPNSLLFDTGDQEEPQPEAKK